MVFGLHKTTHFADISIYPTKNQSALNLRTMVKIRIGFMAQKLVKMTHCRSLSCPGQLEASKLAINRWKLFLESK